MMQEVAAVPSLVWVILCWQAAMVAIALVVWLILRATRREEQVDALREAPPAPTPVAQVDAPGLRTIATFSAFRNVDDLDAEDLDVFTMFEELMERLEALNAEIISYDEPNPDIDEQRCDLIYRDERYSALLLWDGEEGGLTLSQVAPQTNDEIPPADSFATRELLMELHRFLRHAEVTDVRWHARQNYWAGNDGAWAKAPF